MDDRPPEPTPSGLAGDVPAQRPPTDAAIGLAPLVPTGPPVVKARRSRWRTALAVVLAVAPLLFVAGIPLAFRSYDVATRPDRTAPDVTVHNYLQAFLADRDDSSAAQYACSDQTGLSALRTFRATIESGERRAGQAVSFTWVEGTVVPAGTDSASLDVRIVATVGGVSGGGSETDMWSFTVHRSGQWCVASAAKLG